MLDFLIYEQMNLYLKFKHILAQKWLLCLLTLKLQLLQRLFSFIIQNYFKFLTFIISGTQNQTIKITNHSGTRLNDIKVIFFLPFFYLFLLIVFFFLQYYSKYLGQRIGAVSCLQFHPHEPFLIAGNTDGVVAVYQSAAI